MEAYLLFAAFGLAILGILFWRFVWPKLAVPRGLHIGPIIRGKSRSVGVPKYLDERQGFDFPQRDKGHVHALVQPLDRIAGKKITLRYRIDAASGVTFHAYENPAVEGTVSLMIQRKGDDYSAKGEKVLYRLYAPNPQPLAAGEHTLVADLDNPEGWIGIMSNGVDDAIMAGVLNNLAAIHVCFGAAGGRAHGAFASGPARFTLLALETV